MTKRTIPNRAVRGSITQNIPSGYLLGRIGKGEGKAELISLKAVSQAIGTSPSQLPSPSDITSTFALSGDITPPQITGRVDSYNPTGWSSATVMRLSTSATWLMTGLAGGADGRIAVLINIGANNLVISQTQDFFSFAQDRFWLSDVIDLVIKPNASATFWYDSTLLRWRPIAYNSSALAGLLGYGTNGIVTQTTTGTFVGRTIVGTANQVIVTNGDGVAGNPTLTLDATLVALGAYNTNGLLTQTAADTFTGRTLTGTANEVTVTNGSGVAGNPTISLPAALTFTGKTVTGGTFTAITDIAVADGGTGASTAAAARANLNSNVRVVKAADQTTADYTAGVLVTWDTEDIDTDNWHSTVSNTSRLTVPTGVAVAEFTGAIAVDLTTSSTWKNLYLYKNGSLYIVFWWNHTPTDVHWAGHFHTGPLPVTAGDYFELFFQEQSDVSVTIKSAWSFFSAKALG